MTFTRPPADRICVVNCGLPSDKCACWQRMFSDTPIATPEPLRPGELDERAQRASLAQAIDDEIALFDEAIAAANGRDVPEHQLFAIRVQRASLRRILECWTDGATYAFDKEDLSFERKGK